MLLQTLERTRTDSAFRAEQREALRNTSIKERKDNCLHGAVAPNAGVNSGLVGYQAVFDVRAQSVAAELPIAAAFIQGHRSVPWADLRGVLLSQATDAAMAADFKWCRNFIRQALYIDAAGAGPAGRALPPAAVADVIARTQESVVEARAFLAAQTRCGCLGPKYTELCALPGCGRAHEVDGAVLRVCTRCRAAWYCGREHQQAHWAGHKKACKKAAGEATSGSGVSAAAAPGS